MAEQEVWSNLCTQFSPCGLTGAAAFFAGIPDAEIVINGPMWCYFYALRYLEKGDVDIAKRFQGTQPDNQAIVYGTEDCLLETLADYKTKKNPGVLFLANSCAVGLIGDDLAGIAQQAELDCPVVCLDSGGLKGSFSEGYNMAALAYLEKMELPPRRNCQDKTVNLLGCSAAYYNGKNDFVELKRMLNAAGYTVVAAPGMESTTKEIADLTKASLNIVIHAELGLALAQQLKDKYDMPFIAPPLPYGLLGAKAWLENAQAALPTDIGACLTEIAAAEHEIFARVNEVKMTWGELWFDRAIVAASSSVAVGLALALRREWADVGELIVILQNTPCQMVKRAEFDRTLCAGQDGQAIAEILNQLEHGLLLGSSNESAFMQRAAKQDIVSVHIALPVCEALSLSDLPFMGIRGAKYMIERLWNSHMQNILQRSAREEVKS